MYKKGIIHRDLKPENILIQKTGNNPDQMQLKIADFGFSKAVSNFQKELMTSMLGTPLYMAP
jgi:serine/threonine protein kinase